jgi:hypothetical protein
LGKRFTGICIVTERVAMVRDFYQRVLQTQADGEDRYSRVLVDGAELTLFRRDGIENMASGSTNGAGSGSSTLDVEVADVNWEY